MNLDWKALLRSIAPTLGAAVGGPAGGLAVKFLADKFLGNHAATEDQVAEAVLSSSPEKLLEIKKLDQQFAVQMKQLDIDVFKLEVEDKKSARDLARLNMTPHIILTVVYSVGYFGILYLFMTSKIAIDATIADTFNQVVGVLTAAQITIMAFWFGSSYGSKVKDAKA